MTGTGILGLAAGALSTCIEFLVGVFFDTYKTGNTELFTVNTTYMEIYSARCSVALERDERAMFLILSVLEYIFLFFSFGDVWEVVRRSLN